MAYIALNKVLADFCSHDWIYQEHNVSFYIPYKWEAILNCCVCGCELEMILHAENQKVYREESFELFCKDGIIPLWHDEIEVQFLVNYTDPNWLADGYKLMFEGYSCNAVINLKEKIQMMEALA